MITATNGCDDSVIVMVVHQFDSGGGVGVGVIVTVVCNTESRDADRLPTRNRVTASRSGSPLPSAAVPAPPLPILDVATTAAPLHVPVVPSGSALLPAHCTAPPRPKVTDSHFCLPLFFFLRLKKQQHLEMKQTLIGLRVVPLAVSVVGQHRACSNGANSRTRRAIKKIDIYYSYENEREREREREKEREICSNS